MVDASVIMVLLRRPRRNKTTETRSDPFWEFGSFGVTHCHCKNLMNPKKADRLRGVRLAFAQGGQKGFKLVFLTPSIQIKSHRETCEAKWTADPKRMAFKYHNAPILINNERGNNGYKYTTDFSLLRSEIESVDRPTPVAKFSSKFRTQVQPVPNRIARQITRVYESRMRKGVAEQFITSYEEALPEPPPRVDKHRRKTYLELLRQAQGRRKSHC